MLKISKYALLLVLTLFLVSCGNSNPLIGTWYANLMGDMPKSKEGDLAQGIAEGFMQAFGMSKYVIYKFDEDTVTMYMGAQSGTTMSTEYKKIDDTTWAFKYQGEQWLHVQIIDKDTIKLDQMFMKYTLKRDDDILEKLKKAEAEREKKRQEEKAKAEKERLEREAKEKARQEELRKQEEERQAQILKQRENNEKYADKRNALAITRVKKDLAVLQCSNIKFKNQYGNLSASVAVTNTSSDIAYKKAKLAFCIFDKEGKPIARRTGQYDIRLEPMSRTTCSFEIEARGWRSDPMDWPEKRDLMEIAAIGVIKGDYTAEVVALEAEGIKNGSKVEFQSAISALRFIDVDDEGKFFGKEITATATQKERDLYIGPNGEAKRAAETMLAEQISKLTKEADEEFEKVTKNIAIETAVAKDRNRLVFAMNFTNHLDQEVTSVTFTPEFLDDGIKLGKYNDMSPWINLKPGQSKQHQFSISDDAIVDLYDDFLSGKAKFRYTVKEVQLRTGRNNTVTIKRDTKGYIQRKYFPNDN